MFSNIALFSANKSATAFFNSLAVFSNDINILDKRSVSEALDVLLNNSLNEFRLFNDDFLDNRDFNLLNLSLINDVGFIVFVNLVHINLPIVVDVNVDFSLDDVNDGDRHLNGLDNLLFDDLFDFLDDLDLLLNVLDDLLWHFFDVLDALLNVDGNLHFFHGELHVLLVHFGGVSCVREVKIVGNLLARVVVLGSGVSPSSIDSVVVGVNVSVGGQAEGILGVIVGERAGENGGWFNWVAHDEFVESKLIIN